MDKKNTIIGVVLLVIGFALLITQQPPTPVRTADEAPSNVATATDASTTDAVSGASPETGASDAKRREVSLGKVAPAEIKESQERKKEETPILENEFIQVKFTSWGGAIKEVALLKYPVQIDSTEPYRLNAHSSIPALNLKVADGDVLLDFDSSFEIAQQDANSITFSRDLTEGVRIERSYTIEAVEEDAKGALPYLIKHRTRIVNERDDYFVLRNILIGTGTAEPAEADPQGWYLNFGYFDGEDASFNGIKDFNASQIPFFSRPAREHIREMTPVRWISVKNQFFTGVLTAETPAVGYVTKPVALSTTTAEGIVNRGVTGSMIFEGATIESGGTFDLDLQYYAGPKEYPRLSQLEHREDLVMQFGWFGLISKLLLHVLNSIESVVKNYGVAIILVTIMIRLCLWPLTAKAAKSSKRMAKIQEPLKEIREKYKNDPEKLNRETLKLFKEHKVNPAAGCLPLIIQIPILFGFFYMLRTASELRFAPFVGWINDLSQADVMFEIAGFPIRLLPLLMGISMFFVMRMTPTTLDSMQKKIFGIMPLIVTFFCYNFSSGLVLYWTTSNCISIIQQRITNRQKDEPEPEISVDPKQSGKKKKMKHNYR